MKRIILITGGARSGKSTYAEKLALKLSHSRLSCHSTHLGRRIPPEGNPASGTPGTGMDKHRRAERTQPPPAGGTDRPDRLHHLMVYQLFFDLHSDTDRALAAVKAEFDRFTAQDATFIFVTNEIGMGGASENELQRKFTDMQGWMNQYVAARADEVILMVSGIPLTVKTLIHKTTNN